MNWEENGSNFIGTKGERLKDLEVILEVKHSFFTVTTGRHSYFYQFKYENDILVWWTDVLITSATGTKMIISGTVKDHIINYGKEKTVLTRVRIKEVLH